MLETKLFEVRDRATMIAVIAIRIAPYELPEGDAERYLMRRVGYGEPLVLLTKLYGDTSAHYDPTAWSDPAMRTAHKYVADKWPALYSGGVVDCEFIRGETTTPKFSERQRRRSKGV